MATKRIKSDRAGNTLAFSINAAAVACGMDDKTLRSKLSKAGIKQSKAGLITLRQFYISVTGDKEAEQTRLIKAQADIAEREDAEARVESVQFRVMQAIIERANSAVKQALIDIPARWASRFNPTDPELAKAAADTCIDELLKLLGNNWDEVKKQIKADLE
jgi:phage terminase Nu1 subunit (DNA packaging protein)